MDKYSSADHGAGAPKHPLRPSEAANDSVHGGFAPATPTPKPKPFYEGKQKASLPPVGRASSFRLAMKNTCWNWLRKGKTGHVLSDGPLAGFEVTTYGRF